jgi:hypothetical protein
MDPAALPLSATIDEMYLAETAFMVRGCAQLRAAKWLCKPAQGQDNPACSGGPRHEHNTAAPAEAFVRYS